MPLTHTQSDVMRLIDGLRDVLGSQTETIVNDTFGARFTDTSVRISAKEIVESGRYYPGDASPYDIEQNGAEYAFIETFEWKESEISDVFRESIKRDGVQYPITLVDIPAGYRYPAGIRVNDGHHRLLVAYELGIDVPVHFITLEQFQNDEYFNSPETVGLPMGRSWE